MLDSIFSWHFPDLLYTKLPDISLIAIKFHDISRLARQVVTLNCRSANTLPDDKVLQGISKCVIFIIHNKCLTRLINAILAMCQYLQQNNAATKTTVKFYFILIDH